MSHAHECWHCHHRADVPDDPAKSEYRCDECGASTAFGVALPRITITPHPSDRRFIVSKFETGGDKPVEVEIILSRSNAAEYALELLSITEPTAFNVLQSAVRLSDAVASRDEGVSREAKDP
jgi:hypothetical protein